MDEYPHDLMEFERWFGTEQACRDYLLRIRWPNGFVCPRCDGRAGWTSGRGLVTCKGCGRQTSVTAGTIFQDTHKPLSLWFRAMWLVTSQKTGASALGVQRVLGLGSYETAWTWLHKLRRAMVRPGRERLSGRVEVDECYWGAEEEGVRGRELGGKAIVVVAAEESGAGIGRVRLGRLPDASAASIGSFLAAAVEPGSVVHTDGWRGYARVEVNGYTHEVSPIRGRKKLAGTLMPRTHRVISLLKRWLTSTHQGAISHEHLDYYLDEFTFRFNRRASRSRGKLFLRLVQQAAQVEPVPYEALVRHVQGRGRRSRQRHR
jgi:transposase-like protein